LARTWITAPIRPVWAYITGQSWMNWPAAGTAGLKAL
jgi:hypothetical protein